MRGQFDKLILKPLQKLDTLKQDDRSNVSSYINVIVIDALDECEGDSDIRLILQLLPQIHDSDTATYPRVLLTSRPDLPIRLGFSKLVRQNYKDFSLHDIPLEVIEKDISLFFNHRFEEIITDRFLPTQWPGESDFDRLVALSVPLFIFAATICRIFSWSYDCTVCLWNLAADTISNVWRSENIYDISAFSRGSFYFKPGWRFSQVEMSFSKPENPDISIDDGQWIKLNGERAVWLPVEYRDSGSIINGNMITLGHASGRVSFIQSYI